MNREQSILLREKYQGKECPDFWLDVHRLSKGEPLDYVIGWRIFLGTVIDLKHKPLIPRDETEFWCEKAINEIKGNNKTKVKCLDLFAGSGCIGLAVLANVENAYVVFGEIDKSFIKQVRLNAKINKIDTKRLKVMQSDIFSNIKGKFDYILANPPYIALDKKHLTQKSVIKHEPKQALFSGKDGLKIIKRFLKKLPEYLEKNGVCYLEFDAYQIKELKAWAKGQKTLKFEFYKDQFGLWRFARITFN